MMMMMMMIVMMMMVVVVMIVVAEGIAEGFPSKLGNRGRVSQRVWGIVERFPREYGE